MSGIDSLFQTKVGDNLGRITSTLRQALDRSDAVIVCGGLGPTHDDITTACIARAFGRGSISAPGVGLKEGVLVDLARRQGHASFSLVTANAVSGGFLSFGLMADKTYALADAQVRVMDLKAMARVTKIAHERLVELAEQQRAIAVARESQAQSEAQAAAEVARALAVSAEEKVFTAREVELAERKKLIDLIAASQVAEHEALRLTSAASAERDASAARGAAIRAQAEADADADKIRSLATRLRGEVEAEALRLMNEAHNMLSPEARMSALRMRLVEKAEAIIRESVRPMERIEGIKILHVDGLGGSGSGHGELNGGGGNFADGIVNSALRFRAQAPLVDQLLREIGLEGGDIQRLVGAASGAQVALPPASAPQAESR